MSADGEVAAPTGPVREVAADSAGLASAREALDVDGVVCLRAAFGEPWLDAIEEGISEALAGASADLDIVKREGDEGSFTFSSGAWRSVDSFGRLIFDSHLPDLAWALLGSDRLGLFYDFLLIKGARSNSAATPWHQDHSYYPLDGHQLINCWIALDSIPEETTLRFLAGSHRAHTLYRAVDFDDPGTQYRHAREQLSPPPGPTSNAQILATALAPGDMLAWTSYTLHCAPGNHLDQRRAAFSVSWVGDDIVFNGAASLETYRDVSQVAGQPITCDKFPLVRPLGAA